LAALYKTYGSQVTWNAFSKHTSIDHPKTVQDYAETLEDMDALFIQHALIEDKLLAAPKKAKKLYLTDPFIYHALHSWIFYPDKEKPAQLTPLLVETVVVNNFRRYYPTFYIKGEGEVDIAYIRKNKFWPIEIKWTAQLHPKDLKQILKYKNNLILTKSTFPYFLVQLFNDIIYVLQTF
jgi:predicted AAA+ superfamily ATPase